MGNSIISVVEGVTWPALPSAQGAGRLAVLFQLEQSQWWSLEKIRLQQMVQINKLLRHCVEHVPYYQKLLNKNRVLNGINEEQWLNIPILTRDRVQRSGELLRAKFLPPNHGKASLQRTSGSTGKPVETLNTDMTRFFWDVFTLREHLWHQRDLSGKLAAIRFNLSESVKPPYGGHADTWGRATNDVFETGSAAILSIFSPISEQIAWLQREAPDYLLTHPSVLQELALHCQREAIQFPFLKEVRTISESLPDGLRELCEKVWGVKLVDMYTSIELGYLAVQCPEHDHYHVQSEGVLIEVLDDNGKPCAPGQIGKVVVTNLHNFATPLIRYELGDYAEVGEPCPCGRGLPVLTRILGRYRNLVTLPNGEQHWPIFGVGKILEIAPVLQHQAIQHSIKDVEFLLVVERALNSEEKQKLLELFLSNLHPEMNVTIREVDSIERSASGKFEEFISNL